MHQNFFRTLCLGFLLLTLNTSGYAGRYTSAFESAVKNSLPYHFVCHPTNVGGKWAYVTSQQSVEVGRSVGPGGTTTHYKNAPVTRTIKGVDKYRCKHCGRILSSLDYESPRVFIQQKDNKIVMTIYLHKKIFDISQISDRMCAKPRLNEDLTLIWEKAGPFFSWHSGLENMWKVARELDEEESKNFVPDPLYVSLYGNQEQSNQNHVDNVEYVVETQSSSCCIQ